MLPHNAAFDATTLIRPFAFSRRFRCDLLARVLWRGGAVETTSAGGEGGALGLRSPSPRFHFPPWGLPPLGLVALGLLNLQSLVLCCS